MIHRLPVSDVVRAHVNSILILTLNLIKEDNEENVLICLRIIIDLHKQYRPAYYPQVKRLCFQNFSICFNNFVVLDKRFLALHPNDLLQSSQSHGQNLQPKICKAGCE